MRWFPWNKNRSPHPALVRKQQEVLLWERKRLWYQDAQPEGKIIQVCFSARHDHMWAFDIIKKIVELHPEISIAVTSLMYRMDAAAFLADQKSILTLPAPSSGTPAPYKTWRNVAFLGEDVTVERARYGYDCVFWFMPPSNVDRKEYWSSTRTERNDIPSLKGADGRIKFSLTDNRAAKITITSIAGETSSVETYPLAYVGDVRPQDRLYHVEDEEAERIYQLLGLNSLIFRNPLPAIDDKRAVEIKEAPEFNPSSVELEMLEMFDWVDPQIRNLALGMLRSWFPTNSSMEIGLSLFKDQKSLDGFYHIIEIANSI